MTDNRQNPGERAFALPDLGVVRLQGPDAHSFAQAQFANDLNLLEDGRWQWNAWLTAKGRVIAVFALLRLAGDAFVLVTPDVPAVELANALRRFVFRKKVVIETPSDLHPQGLFEAPRIAQGALAGHDGSGIELDFGSPTQPRALWLLGGPGTPDAAAAARWRDIDLTHGLPRLDASQREQWTPQQLSLDRLRAFSVKKGCYPGQEIVARTHFLGKAKRGLALFESRASLQPGTTLEDAGQPLGAIISTGAGVPAPVLAVIPLDHGTGVPTAGDQALTSRVLLDGLAR